MAIEISNEDNMELMSRYPNNYFQLAICDPPYGIGEAGQRNKTGDRPTAKWKNPKSQTYKTFDDSGVPLLNYWQELFRVSKNQVVWGGNYFSEFLPSSKGWIVWDKGADIKEHLSMCELAWTSFDIKCNKFDYLWAGFKKKHQVDKILDTHLGSGSIAIACHDYGFDLTACELDPDYYKAAMKRINQHMAQTTLF